MKKPIFRADSEIDQLDAILRVCGTPTEQTWPGVTETLKFKEMMPKKRYARQLAEHFVIIPPLAISLMDQLLCMDPRKRISATDALRHEFVNIDPSTVPPIALPSDQGLIHACRVFVNNIAE